MTPQTEQVLREALDLPPIDRAELVEQILASLGDDAVPRRYYVSVTVRFLLDNDVGQSRIAWQPDQVKLYSIIFNYFG